MVLGIPFLFLFSPIMWPDITLPLGSMACPWFPIIHSYSYSSKYEMGFLYMPTNESESQINVLSICLSCDWIIFQPFSSSSHPQDLATASSADTFTYSCLWTATAFAIILNHDFVYKTDFPRRLWAPSGQRWGHNYCSSTRKELHT